MRVNSKDVYEWIEHKLGKKDPIVGERICPFAKKTVETKTIQVVHGVRDLGPQIDHCCDLFDTLALECVVIYIQYKISEARLSQICGRGHKQNPNYAVMYDHPSNNGLHRGVSFSFGKCPLVFIQPLKELKEAQGKLRKTAYYDNWGITHDDDMFY